MPVERLRLGYLDSLRGLAALAVVYHHSVASYIQNQHIATGWEYNLWHFVYYSFRPGTVGVVVFFAISGFIIPVSFAAKQRPALSFAISRFFRLYPAYWVTLAFAVAVYYILPTIQVDWRSVFANATMAQSLFGEPSIVWVSWTLFIELVFYVICLAAFLCNRLNQTGFCFASALFLLGLSVLSGIANHLMGTHAPNGLLIALAIMMWASTWREFVLRDDLRAKRLAFIGLGAFAFLIPVSFFLSHPPGDWRYHALAYLLGIAIFVCCTRYLKMTSRTLSWLGAISYSVYLTHTVLIDLLSRHLRFAGATSPHMYFGIVICLTLALSSCMYYGLEKPAIELGRNVRSRVARAEPTLVAVEQG